MCIRDRQSTANTSPEQPEDLPRIQAVRRPVLLSEQSGVLHAAATARRAQSEQRSISAKGPSQAPGSEPYSAGASTGCSAGISACGMAAGISVSITRS